MDMDGHAEKNSFVFTRKTFSIFQSGESSNIINKRATYIPHRTHIPKI